MNFRYYSYFRKLLSSDYLIIKSFIIENFSIKKLKINFFVFLIFILFPIIPFLLIIIFVYKYLVKYMFCFFDILVYDLFSIDLWSKNLQYLNYYKKLRYYSWYILSDFWFKKLPEIFFWVLDKFTFSFWIHNFVLFLLYITSKFLIFFDYLHSKYPYIKFSTKRIFRKFYKFFVMGLKRIWKKTVIFLKYKNITVFFQLFDFIKDSIFLFKELFDLLLKKFFLLSFFWKSNIYNFRKKGVVYLDYNKFIINSENLLFLEFCYFYYKFCYFYYVYLLNIYIKNKNINVFLYICIFIFILCICYMKYFVVLFFFIWISYLNLIKFKLRFNKRWIDFLFIIYSEYSFIFELSICILYCLNLSKIYIKIIKKYYKKYFLFFNHFSFFKIFFIDFYRIYCYYFGKKSIKGNFLFRILFFRIFNVFFNKNDIVKLCIETCKKKNFIWFIIFWKNSRKFIKNLLCIF